MMVNWHEFTYVDASRKLNQLGSRTVRGRLWTASNLRSFTRRHGITRELHMPPMQKVVDVPGIPKEYAILSLVPVLEVTDGIRSPHVITRIIEKGDEEALARLRDAVRTDPVVRSEVLALAPDLLDHPWAGPEYHEFLDLARTSLAILAEPLHWLRALQAAERLQHTCGSLCGRSDSGSPMGRTPHIPRGRSLHAGSGTQVRRDAG